MMFLGSIEDRWNILNDCAARAEEVLISSYNIYTGVDRNGRIIQSQKTRPARIFMRAIDKPSTKILVGVPPNYSCSDGCVHCAEKREGLVNRFLHHSNTWGEMNIRFARELHLKLYLFKISGNWIGYTGGVNLSLSDWDDILMQIPEYNIQEALELFAKLWEEKPETMEVLRDWSFD